MKRKSGCVLAMRSAEAIESPFGKETLAGNMIDSVWTMAQITPSITPSPIEEESAVRRTLRVCVVGETCWPKAT